MPPTLQGVKDELVAILMTEAKGMTSRQLFGKITIYVNYQIGKILFAYWLNILIDVRSKLKLCFFMYIEKCFVFSGFFKLYSLFYYVLRVHGVMFIFSCL